MPAVPSKTCTTAFEPDTSRICPLRTVPSGNVKLTISANFGNLTLSNITNGPLTPTTVLYAKSVNNQIR